jgi:hypothetical protein
MQRSKPVWAACWLLWSSACALSGAPTWVRQGHIDCDLAPCPTVLSATGQAGAEGSITNKALRRTAAETNARDALAKLVSARLRGAPTDPFRSFVAQTLAGTEIVDHWVAKNGAEFALAEVSQESLHQALQLRTDLKPEERDALEKQAASLFGP